MNRRQFLQAVPSLAAAPLLARSAFAGTGRGNSIQSDSDGTLRVGGRREFILGLYQAPAHPEALREASQAGFNLINRSPTAASFDEAHALGLWGWTALGSLPVPTPAAERAAAETRMRATIESLRAHPALLFWETEDEPTFVWKEPLRLRTPPAQINDTAAFIRAHDPAHPLYLNESPTNLVRTLQAYSPAADIVATDIYPVIPHGAREQYALWPDGRQGDFLNTFISQVGDYADKMRRVAGPERAVFMVLQGFAWEGLRDKDKGQDPAMILYPNAAQLRFMAWQSIVHGVNGLIWWGLSYTPYTAPLWSDLKTIAREISQVRDALSARRLRVSLKIDYRDTGHSLDRGVEWIAKSLGRGNGILLAAVNADGNPVDATISGLKRYRKCEPVVGGGTAELVAGQLHEKFEPFGTRVWRLMDV